MAQKPRQPRTNRYKKQNGKGLTALAVFLVLLLALLVGGYYFFAWQQQEEVFKPQQHAAPAIPHVAPPASPVPADALPNKEPGPDWEHYTDDTPRPAVKLPPAQQPLPAGNAELAIIVDDMGSSLQELRRLLAIGVPLTLAVIPGLRHDREVAALADSQGAEVMLHLPMQSKEYPRRRLEANGLLLSYDQAKLQQLVEGYLTQVPQAKGANNHMGSAFTEDEPQMRAVLSLLSQRGLFFVDSVTTPASVGSRLAAELGMKSARRDVFLDNEQQEAYIMGQLSTAVNRARKTGRAIAICHPHPVTIATLAKALPTLQQQGITLVYASRLVR
jgi:uncharacterized protein